jgi:type IX secretion system PorP/SprF family membrane protein
MKKIIFLTLIAIAHTGLSQVANYDYFGFRLGNMFNVNPAWVTRDEGINIALNGQTFNPTIDYANKNLMAGIYSTIGNRSGLGLKVINDVRGAFQTFRADLSYGFHAKLSESHSLRFGLLGGVNNNALRTARIENSNLLDFSDPTLSSSYFNTTQFVAGAGLLYTFKGLDVSLSLPQIVSTTKPLNSYIHSAVFYKIKAGDKFIVQPWVSYQNMPVSKNLTCLYVKGTYNELLWAQVGYQSNKSIHGAVGVMFENIGLGYGFRSSNKEFSQISSVVHEVTFTINIKKGKKSEPKITTNNSLEDIIRRLDGLLSQEVTAQNKEKLREELGRIKEMLKKAEIDNSDPEKALEVEKQLLLIEEKLKNIEDKLKD